MSNAILTSLVSLMHPAYFGTGLHSSGNTYIAIICMYVYSQYQVS